MSLVCLPYNKHLNLVLLQLGNCSCLRSLIVWSGFTTGESSRKSLLGLFLINQIKVPKNDTFIFDKPNKKHEKVRLIIRSPNFCYSRANSLRSDSLRDVSAESDHERLIYLLIGRALFGQPNVLLERLAERALRPAPGCCLKNTQEGGNSRACQKIEQATTQISAKISPQKRPFPNQKTIFSQFQLPNLPLP